MLALPSWIKGPKDFLAGMIFVCVGLIFFIWSHQYNMGTATRMGPGYYPSLLSIILCLFGVGSMIKGVTTRIADPLPQRDILPLFFMVASVVSFGLLIEHTGFIVASFVSLVLICYQRLRTKPLEVLLIFLALTLFNYIVFIRFFGMPMPVFWFH